MVKADFERLRLGFEIAEEVESVVEGREEGAETARGGKEPVGDLISLEGYKVITLAVVDCRSAYLFIRRMTRSGVAAYEVIVGAFFFTSAAMDFSDAGGMLVAPFDGAPGSAAGSDIGRAVVVGCDE